MMVDEFVEGIEFHFPQEVFPGSVAQNSKMLNLILGSIIQLSYLIVHKNSCLPGRERGAKLIRISVSRNRCSISRNIPTFPGTGDRVKCGPEDGSCLRDCSRQTLSSVSVVLLLPATPLSRQKPRTRTACIIQRPSHPGLQWSNKNMVTS